MQKERNDKNKSRNHRYREQKNNRKLSIISKFGSLGGKIFLKNNKLLAKLFRKKERKHKLSVSEITHSTDIKQMTRAILLTAMPINSTT